MAVAPLRVRYINQSDAAHQQVANVALSRVGAAVGLQGGGAFPVGHLAAGTHNFVVTRIAEGAAPPTGPVFGVALVLDDSDVAGDYTVAGDVADYVTLGNINQFTNGQVIQLTIPEAGVWRVVITTGNTAAIAQDIGAGSYGGTDPDYHFDSDGNEDEGGLSLIDRAGGTGGQELYSVGAIGARATLQSVTAPDNQKYGDTPAITVNMAPVGSAQFADSRYNVRTAITTDADGDPRVKTFDVTPDADGDVTTGTYNVDTQFAAGINDHYLQVGVNDTLGNATTPAGQQPALYSVGTLEDLTTTQRSWVIFDTAGHGTGIVRESASRARDGGTTTVSPDVSLHDSSSGGSPGVAVFNDSARTVPSRLFRRQAPVDLAYSHPYLRGWVFDGYGNPLASTNVRVEVRRNGTSTSENQQDLTTDANGRIQWDYQIARTHTAFNRFKTSLNTVDDALAPPVTFAAAEVADADPFPPFEPGNHDFSGPYPAYGKDVWLQGRAYSGTNEPTDLEVNEFGVNSEGWFASLWTGNLAQAFKDADGVPDGVGTRTKNLGTGSLRMTPTSEYDEGNGTVVDPTRWGLRDVAGRRFDVDNNGTSDYWHPRWGSWNQQTDVEESALASPTGNNRISTTLGHTTSFLQHDAPTDPSVVYVHYGFADSTVRRGNFTHTGLTAYGFAGGTDEGNYGAIQQIVQFIAVDPDLGFFVAPELFVQHPDEPNRLVARMIRLLPSNEHATIEPDAPLHIKVLRVDGTIEVVVDEAMTQIGSTDDYEYEFAPGAAGSYSVLVTGFKDGSRPPDAGDVVVRTGTKSELEPLAIILKPADTGSHFAPGGQLLMSYSLFDTSGGTAPAFDDDPTVVVLRVTLALALEFLDSDLSWQPFVDLPSAYQWPMTGGTIIFADTSGFTDNDLLLVFDGVAEGQPYSHVEVFEVNGSANSHGGYALDAIDLALNGTLSQR